MDTGELLTRWTVRAAVLLWSVGLSLRAAGRDGPTARRAWAVGCLAIWVHIVCAFAFFHSWSLDDAYEATRRQTEATTGFNWGGGLYVNFVFGAVWTFDAAWRLARPGSYATRGFAWESGIQGFLWFIVFNGAVVFAGEPIRWFGLAACATPLLIAAGRWATRDRVP